MTVENVFFLVWREDGPGPTRKHASRASAFDEAQRLARWNPGQRFVVLEARAGFQVSDMQRTEYESEISF